jgi:uncharacterized protein (DUF433 family)
MRMHFSVIEGDITALEVDAIANAANNALWMGAGVAGAIKRAGGDEIEREAVAKGPIEVGEAVAAGAGRLAAKWVIHGAVMGQDLRTDAGELFLDRYGELLHLSRSGQLAIREVFEQHLRRVEWDPSRFPVRLYPFVLALSTVERPIAIDAEVAFGRPIVLRSGVSTRAIADRIDAGESVADIARDYEMEEAEIRQAVLYERAA